MENRLYSREDYESSKPTNVDKIEVRNLRVEANAGFDAWGRAHSQPVLISLTLGLKQPTVLAAREDKVNSSTIHYGQLCKALKTAAESNKDKWLGAFELATLLVSTAVKQAHDADSIASVELTTFFPKATLLGEGSGLVLRHLVAKNITSVEYFVQNLRIPTLIGVNPHEREAKQMVLVSIWVDRAPVAMSNASRKVEQTVVTTTELSAADTLEALSEKIAMDIVYNFLRAFLKPEVGIAPASIRVRLEKPVATVYADAPIVEIWRSTKSDSDWFISLIKTLSERKKSEQEQNGKPES